MVSITPIIDKEIVDFLKEEDLIFSLVNQFKRPIHIGFPQNLYKNVNIFKDCFDQNNFKGKIFLAHKATKNQAFIKEALKLGINIEVSSKAELISALSCGFVGTQIEAAGPKNNEFLQLLLLHNCLISLDSESELNRVLEIRKYLNLSHKTNILLRINSLNTISKKINIKKSKFGVCIDNLECMYVRFAELNSQINFQGLHFHQYGYDIETKIDFLNIIIQKLELAYQYNLSPSIINFGGTQRTKTIVDYSQWSDFISKIEEDVLNNTDSSYVWGSSKYGLELNGSGRIKNKETALSKFYNSTLSEDLKNMFLGEFYQNGNSIASVLAENIFEIMFEPGHSLLQQCGISLCEVIETKSSGCGQNLIVMDANSYNLSLVKMSEYNSNTILIKKNKLAVNTDYKAFLVGNICQEDDFLSPRIHYFNQLPETGDVIVFTNTAPYLAGFEDASPMMHPLSKQLVAYKNNNLWRITNPENYNPYITQQSHDL